MDAKPYPKTTQLARGERRYRRKVASPKRWQKIIDAKRGPCRICQLSVPVEYHHLVPRSVGGSDVPENIVPLCRDCHASVTVREQRACAALRLSLSDDEYAYANDTLGEARFEDRFPVEYRNA